MGRLLRTPHSHVSIIQDRYMARILFFLIVYFASVFSVSAQQNDLQNILNQNSKAVERASRKTLAPVLQILIDSKLKQVPEFLENWRGKKVWMRKSDRNFFYVKDKKPNPKTLIDISTGESIGFEPNKNLKLLKPNSGVRSIIASTLVQFQLIDNDPKRRISALTAIERDSNPSHLTVLRATINKEKLPQIKSRMARLERLLTIRFDKNQDERISAIKSFESDTNVDVRASLNPILKTKITASKTLPKDINIASQFKIDKNLTQKAAYQILVDKKLAPALISIDERNKALIANIKSGKVGNYPVSTLNTQVQRDTAYQELANAGKVPAVLTEVDLAKAVANHQFYKVYIEPNKAVTTTAKKTVNAINSRVELFSFIDLGLDGLSLASIYFLAAIGLAITFGVMGVINMAHGEFIMIGAYTGYVVQQFVPNYTLSIVIALPMAFIVAFAAGVALERLVIRHLMHRPLETLLATFGISIALQQLAKNIFGTQARPLTSPDWLGGSWVINDIISISYIRVAIFFLALAFLFLLLFILKKTRLGLEVRAVTQNPRMASSMGINPDKINMLTFGLGSGIAGIAGVAIGLFAQVTSELGSGYIVQSFMTVVVGGVGNIWGTLAGASMIGGLQKIIEWFNPSNTLAAQTYMIIFIIIFIQFRPKGIVALKGRAAGD